MGMVRLSDISKVIAPGPSMILRPASPKAEPEGFTQLMPGAQNAAVLNHSRALRLATPIAWPGTTLARSEPLTPRPISSVRPKTFFRKCAIFAKGQIEDPVSGELVRLIEIRKASVSRNIEGILCDQRRAASDGRSIVERLRKNVLRAGAEAPRHPFADANRSGVEYGIPFRGLIDKRLATRDKSAFGIEAGPLGAVVPGVQHDVSGQFALQVQIPDLHVAESVIRIDGEVVGYGSGCDRGKTVHQGKRSRRKRRDIGGVRRGLGEGRLEREVLNHDAVLREVVVDAVARANDGTGERTPGDADARG